MTNQPDSANQAQEKPQFPFDNLPIDDLELETATFVFLLKDAWNRSPAVFAKGLQLLVDRLPPEEIETRDRLQAYIARFLEDAEGES